MKTDSQVTYFNYLMDQKGMTTKQAVAEAEMSEATTHKYSTTANIMDQGSILVY